MSDQKKLYEVHIAVPQVDIAVHQSIFAALTNLGITKHKYFYQVNNLRSLSSSQWTKEIPTGHDLAEPGSMSTARIASSEEARHLVLAGMRVLAECGVRGNFEIEKMDDSAANDDDQPTIDDFPGYGLVKNSPLREIHLIWKRTRDKLPKVEHAIQFFEAISGGCNPHQLVDFGIDRTPTECTQISRVVTLYVSNREEALLILKKMSERIQELEESYYFDNNPLSPFPRPNRLIAERVLIVGEPL